MKIIREVVRFVQECKDDNVTAYAAQSAYFTLLSLIPFLLFFGAMLKYTPVSLDFIIKGVNLVLPDYVSGFMVSIIRETYESTLGLISLSAIFAIWSAARGIQYLTEGLNKMYDLEETRNWVVLRFWASIYTFIMIFSLILMLVLLVFGRTLQHWLTQYVPGLAVVTDVLLRLKSLIGIGGLTFIFALFYWAFPNRKGKGGQRITYLRQLPGALICAVAWYLFSFGISVYVNYFHGFSSYGSLATIALIMFWLYFCMYILMVCAEVNNLYSERIFYFLKKRRRQKCRKA
ncbi:MAG: YihY/virulence factor BrkB family protein [bacterium]|nr:YihY/virulence factor BrkB family protein [bacterium]MDY4099503.1 YihY/virulence factor BrkB family protein [Lachnospiraceae bacterium]